MNEEIIRTTITKMRDAGLSDSIIASTLSDLGLTPGQTQAFLSGSAMPSSTPTSTARAPRPTPTYNAPTPPPAPSVSSRASAPMMSDAQSLNHEALASRTSEKIMQRMDEREALDNEEADLKDNIAHLALEQHGQQLQATHEAVMDLHEKFDSTSIDTISNRVTALNNKMDQFSKDLIETKALALAMQGLLQKILEANQQLLFEMKGKK